MLSESEWEAARERTVETLAAHRRVRFDREAETVAPA
mgnify:CR=1 FL=1